ncbi:hypothetical protein LC612_39315 [Nostoc sp. CHAB 5834]|nr:hypothetical protein [Nostoc sp. CHAB 5834]
MSFALQSVQYVLWGFQDWAIERLTSPFNSSQNNSESKDEAPSFYLKASVVAVALLAAQVILVKMAAPIFSWMGPNVGSSLLLAIVGTTGVFFLTFMGYKAFKATVGFVRQMHARGNELATGKRKPARWRATA